MPGDEHLIAMHQLYGVSLAWLHGLPDAHEREQITLSSGATLTDAQLDEALHTRLTAALRERMRQPDKTAKLLRQFVQRQNQADTPEDGVQLSARMAMAPTRTAINALIKELEWLVKTWAVDAVAVKVERHVARTMDPQSATLAALGARLARSEFDQLMKELLPPTSARSDRQLAWGLYRQGATSLQKAQKPALRNLHPSPAQTTRPASVSRRGVSR